MICIKEGMVVGALFFEILELTGHDVHDAAASYELAEYASWVVCGACARFTASAEANDGVLNAESHTQIEHFRQDLLAIAAQRQRT